MPFITKLNYFFIITDPLFLLYKQKSKFFGIILSLLLFQLMISLMDPVQGIKWL